MKLRGAFVPVFLILLFAAACSGKEGRQDYETGGGEDAPRYAAPAWPALALLETGKNPLWFELGEDGPVLVDSPAAASLAPYTPWPHARFITGMRLWETFIVMAVNRDGFLVLAPEYTDTAGSAAGTGRAPLYRISGGGLWDSYTAESFFVWKEKPAVLLYRNDFFTGLSAPPLRPQVYVLDRESPVPLAQSVPALEAFPSGGQWEAETLRLGTGGFWYYRLKEKGAEQAETAYYRVKDIAEEGERISVGEWRNSAYPENPELLPPCAALLLDRAAALLNLKAPPAALVLSPGFESPRFFGDFRAENAAGGEAPAILYLCLADSGALAVLKDGRGLYSAAEEPGVKLFSLPALPEGFSYTGVSFLGDIIAASWEEQREAGIGAAGFMAMRRPDEQVR